MRDLLNRGYACTKSRKQSCDRGDFKYFLALNTIGPAFADRSEGDLGEGTQNEGSILDFGRPLRTPELHSSIFNDTITLLSPPTAYLTTLSHF